MSDSHYHLQPDGHHRTTFKAPIHIYLLIIGIILILYSVSALILIVYSLCKYQSYRSMARPSIMTKQEHRINIINYPTIASATFYVISSCIFIIGLTHFDPYIFDNLELDQYFVICILLFVAFIFLSKLSIYTQYLARMYLTFKESTDLAMSKGTMIISIILLILLLLTIIWWIILISLRHLILNYSFISYNFQFYLIFLLLIILDLCISWLVVGLFIRKLYRTLLLKCRGEFIKRANRELKLINNEDEIDNDDGSKSSNDDKLEEMDAINNITRTYSFVLDIVAAGIDQHDEKTLDLITRQSVLSSFSILTIQLIYITLLIVLIIGIDKINYIALYWLFGGIYYPMDVILTCIALYFNYKFAIKYYKFWCKCCDQRCKLFVVKRAAKVIASKYYKGDLKLKVDQD